MRRTLVLAAIFLATRNAGGKTLLDTFATPTTRPVGVALAESIGRSLPVTAASAGITFRFDKETHAFERETEILGQLFLERPRPLGRGKLNLSLSYQWVHVDRVDGQAIDGLSDTRAFIDDPIEKSNFIFRRFAIDLTTHQVTTSVTYGATDDLDLNLTVPLLESRLGVRALAVNQFGLPLRMRVHGSAFGVGDLFLRGKQRLVDGRFGDLAAGLVLRVPTGEQDDFQGTGDWEASPMLYAATPSWHFATLQAQAYANGGIELNADDVDRSHGRFGAGVDLRIAERATLAVAFLGREAFAGIASPGFFDVRRVNGSRAPFLGLERDRVSTYDLSVGGRLNLWRDTIFGFANVLLPLNDDGFRSDVIPLVGFEAAF